MIRLPPDFKEFLKLLNDHEVKYLVIGGWPVIILEAQAGAVALGVDRLLRTGNVTVRPAPAAHRTALLSGVILDAEGNPCPVLDPEGVVAAIRSAEARAPVALEPVSLPVLIVDDSLTTRMMEQNILEANGYTVELAASAEEALALLESREYGLCLIDVEMPGMYGFDLMRRLRADARWRETPAVMVTTRGSDEDRRRGLECGAQAYLVKSEFGEDVLMRTIRGLMG